MTTQEQAPNTSAINPIKERQQKMWISGNYAKIGNSLVIMGRNGEGGCGPHVYP